MNFQTAKAFFQIPTTLIDRCRGKWPERFTTEFRVVGRGEKPKNMDHASDWTHSERRIAQEGRNGLYSIITESQTYDNYGGGSSPSPHRIGLKITGLFLGYSGGALSRDDALNSLVEFEQEHPEVDSTIPLKGRIPTAKKEHFKRSFS